MSDDFTVWWNGEDLLPTNPYVPQSAAFWAWEGWCAALKMQREKQKAALAKDLAAAQPPDGAHWAFMRWYPHLAIAAKLDREDWA